MNAPLIGRRDYDFEDADEFLADDDVPELTGVSADIPARSCARPPLNPMEDRA